MRHSLVGKIVDPRAALMTRSVRREPTNASTGTPTALFPPSAASRNRRTARRRPGTPAAEEAVSIEINNESEVDVDEAALRRLATFALDHLRAPDARPRHPVRRPGRDGTAESAVDGRARLHRRARVSSRTNCAPAARGRGRSTRAARRPGDHPQVAIAQAGETGHSRRTRCNCSPRTESCTCSATTTPSRTRSARCSRCSARDLVGFTLLGGRRGAPRDRRLRRPRHAAGQFGLACWPRRIAAP